MAFASFDAGDDNTPNAEINMVPLIDVMLVLLIIFMVTAPLMTHAVKVDLPRAASRVDVAQVERMRLTIDAQGRTWWNSEEVDAAALTRHLHDAAALQPQPELHIRADRATPYEKVAQAMSEAARQGLLRIGFVTDPVDDPGAAR